MGLLSKIAGVLAKPDPIDYSNVVAPGNLPLVKRFLKEGLYPPEVQARILSGEIDMGDAARTARAKEQGFDIHSPTLMPRGQLEYHPPKPGESAYTPMGPMLDPSQNGDWYLDDYAKVSQVTDANSSANFWMDDVFYHNTGRRSQPEKGTGYLHSITGNAYNPKEQVRSGYAAFDPKYVGPNTMGGALAGAVGLGALGQSEEADAGFVTRGGKTLLEAWHGSPHKFDRFSMDQIGTGEGAQAYGHGLYFADSEDVARGYRDGLAGSDGYYNGQRIADMGLPTENPEVRALSHATGLLRDGYTDDVKADTLAYFQDDLDQWLGYRADLKDDPDALKYLEAEITDRQAALEAAKGIDYSAINVTPNGHLYRTEIDVTPESLLDWDKPLSEQSEAVRGAIESLDPTTRGMRQYAGEERTGRDFYWGLQAPFKSRSEAESFGISKEDYWLSDDERASKMLREAGIPGIKYLDGDSRSVGEGTSNYVIFDDSLINIAERGNATVPMLATTAGLSGAGLLAANLASPEVKDSGMISAPRSETLFDLTMGARDLERRLEGSPASLLFPSGLVEYLETVNRREEDPSAMTRGMALLDVLPF